MKAIRWMAGLLVVLTPLWAGADLEGIRYQPPPVDDEADPTHMQWATPHTDENTARLTVLVPGQGGRTAQGQPNLYWHIAAPVVSGRMEISLTGEEEAEPLVENSMIVDAGGVKRLSLEELGVALMPDKEYEWLVVLVQDGHDRKRDIIAGGVLRWEPPGRELAMRIHAARPEELPVLYAEEGYWFDAVDALWRLMEKDPGRYQVAWRQLMAQEGLGLAAEPVPAGSLERMLK